MTIWNKLKDELDRAGRAAEQAIDEGRVRLEMHRARQRADRAAQALGYSVHQARKADGDVGAEEYARLAGDLAIAEAEVARLEAQLRDLVSPRSAPADGV
jgi:hypothetical protein